MRVDAQIHGRPRADEECSGDAGSVRTIDDVTWVLLVDGLGHGPVAAEVAALAVDEHERLTPDLSVEAALWRIHARLAGSRGAAATLLRFAGRTLEFGGVGNVTLRTLAGPSIPYIAANGILGRRPLRLRSGEVELDEPGRLLLFTDGIVRTAPIHDLSYLDPDALCRTLLAEHSLERDDATLIHVSFTPGDHE